MALFLLHVYVTCSIPRIISTTSFICSDDCETAMFKSRKCQAIIRAHINQLEEVRHVTGSHAERTAQLPRMLARTLLELSIDTGDFCRHYVAGVMKIAVVVGRIRAHTSAFRFLTEIVSQAAN